MGFVPWSLIRLRVQWLSFGWFLMMMYYIDIGSSIIKRGHQMHVVESCTSKYPFKYIFCTQGFQLCLGRLYPHGFFISMNKDISEVAATTYSSDFHIFRDSIMWGNSHCHCKGLVVRREGLCKCFIQYHLKKLFCHTFFLMLYDLYLSMTLNEIPFWSCLLRLQRVLITGI